MFYLFGCKLSSNGNFHRTQKSLSEQSLKGLFSLNSVFDMISLDISDKVRLFDSMVLPILCYGSEVWGFDIERVHTKFLKQLLFVRQQTINVCMYGETGRMYSLYNLKSNNGAFTNSWTNNVHNLLRELGLPYMIDKNIVSRLYLNLIIQRIHDQYIQTWFSELDQSPKLITYRLYKTSFCYEPYLSRINNYNLRFCLSRFRCSSHKLFIEEGRYHNIARELRLCKYCNMNMIENEYHFLLVCPFYHDLRRKLLPNYYCSWPSTHKFVALITTKSSTVLKRLSSYINNANKRRI